MNQTLVIVTYTCNHKRNRDSKISRHLHLCDPYEPVDPLSVLATQCPPSRSGARYEVLARSSRDECGRTPAISRSGVALCLRRRSSAASPIQSMYTCE